MIPDLQQIPRSATIGPITVTTETSCDYQHLSDQLTRASIPMSPAEAHGIACGLAATGLDDLEGLWRQVILEDVDPDDVLVQECRRSLDELFDATLVQLDDASFGLNLCLPDEQATLTHQAEALRDWSIGFMFGFGLAGEALHKKLSIEASEALQDLAEITRLDPDSVEDDEEGEQAVYQLEEYLRVIALTLRQDALSAGEQEAGE